MRRLALALLATAALVLAPLEMPPTLPAQAADDPTATSSEDAGRLVLVLDSSGSMKERAAGGGTKIAAAKDALRQVAEQLPDDAEVGVRVFGAKVFSRDQPGACTDTQPVVPVGPLDRQTLTEAVADYKPYGETPIGAALQGAAKDLGPAQEGKSRTIVLLSDGEPTCAPDPCKVARQLGNQGVDVKINVVGLDVSGKARRALQCIADAGNGDYYDASSAAELANSMVKVSVRELRGFRLTGERVQGGLASEEALELEPGTYIDTSLPEQDKRYYLIDRPEGGAVSVSAMTRPAKEAWSHSSVQVELLTPDGQQCARGFSLTSQVLGRSPISSAGTEYNQFTKGTFSEQCAAAEQMLASVAIRPADIDYRLEVSSYPAIDNAASLPPAVEIGDQAWVRELKIPATSDPTPVVGGVSFTDAPALEPGTVYADTLRPGEQLVYKVPAGYGQAAILSARLGTDPRASELLGLLGPHVMLEPYTGLGMRLPGLYQNRVSSAATYNGKQPRLLTAAVPEIRLRNAEAKDFQLHSHIHDGDQYFVLGMGTTSDAADMQFAAPVRLKVELVGEVSGEPEYAGDVEGPAVAEDEAPAAEDDAGGADSAPAESEPTDDSALSGALPWALGGVALVVVAVLAFLLGRRRSS